jgi:hypothetical protein
MKKLIPRVQGSYPGVLSGVIDTLERGTRYSGRSVKKERGPYILALEVRGFTALLVRFDA